MGRRNKVATLPDDQLQFVIDHILDGKSDREISFAFQDRFQTKLSRSSLYRWRKAAGRDLADRYRLARYQARQLFENLNLEPDADKHQVLIESIEDHLLAAVAKINTQDPFKLMLIQQEEKRRNLRQREIQLRERAQEFQEEQARQADTLQADRFGIAVDAWRFILSYLLNKEPQAVKLLTKHSKDLIDGLEKEVTSA